ncbi:MAG: tRNA pseudouridine(38-40) synthase TruA [Candidatus Omnitrophota bacterium]
MLRTFKVTLEYDGTDFNGWQLQANAPRTVQGEIEAVLFKIFGEVRIPVIGSGRTDRGVHARGQVAHFRVKTGMAPDELMRAMNYNLPRDVVVVGIEDVLSSFHAQRSAVSKVYTYTILNRSYATALERYRCCFFPRKINMRLLRQEAACFVGRKDFRSFANVDPSRTGGTVRTIKRLEVKRAGDFIRITIESDGFLYKMVRNIVGTLLEVGAGRFPPGSVNQMLSAKNRQAAGLAALPQGLCLEEVKY